MFFASIKMYCDMEGLSVKGQTWPLLHKILGSSLLWFTEASGAIQDWVQIPPNPQQRQCDVSFSLEMSFPMVFVFLDGNVIRSHAELEHTKQMSGYVLCQASCSWGHWSHRACTKPCLFDRENPGSRPNIAESLWRGATSPCRTFVQNRKQDSSL